MLKFTDKLGKLATNRVDYKALLRKGTNLILQKIGITFNGADMKLIDTNSFRNGSVDGVGTEYNMQINIMRFNGETINQYTKPIKDTGILNSASWIY
jgi:hypothetical protein